MMKNYNLFKKYGVLLAVCLLTLNSLIAQINGPACDTYTNVPALTGLGSNTINGVYVANNTLYVATSNGLSISTDGGATFTNRTTANGLGSNNVRTVFVSGDTVYAGTGIGLGAGGISISTDGGATFSNHSINPSPTSASRSITSISASNSKVYFGSNENGYVKFSNDGGATFTLSNFSSNPGVVYGIYAEGNKVYVASITNGGLFISTDGGTNFTSHSLSSFGFTTLNCVYAVGNTVYVGNSSGLGISTDGGTTFTKHSLGDITSIYALNSTIYLAMRTGGLKISTDGGATFTNYTTANGLGSNNVKGVYVAGNMVYVATTGGLSISTDGGATYTNHTTFKLGYVGLGNYVIKDVCLAGNTMYAATTGGLSISTDGGVSYSNKTTANGLGANAVNSIHVAGTTVLAATTGGLSISTDGGANFTNSTTTNGLGGNSVRDVFATGNTIYAATSGGLSISADGGASFTNRTTANGLGNNNVYGVYVSDNAIYAATIAGLSISTDGGATFTNHTTANGLGNNLVNGVYTIGTIVYAATNGGLSISTDGGATFTNRTTANGLGHNLVYGVYAIGTTVYAATNGGLSISTDGGTTFTNHTTTNGLGDNVVNAVFALGNKVYAATNGGFSYCSSQTSKPIASAQTFCSGATVASLVATGTDLKWYDAETGGNALTASTVLTSGTYYVSQTTYENESDRTSVVVTVNPTVAPAAPTASAQAFCGAKTVADLMATGTNLKWYATATGGTALASTTAIATGTYYVSQETSCESDRASVAITVNTITAAPTASNQTVFEGVTVASLVATGTNLKWYTATTGETALASTTVITSGNYYVSQTLNSCESDRTSVAITVIIPVKPPTMTGSGSATSAICSGTGSLSVNLATGATPYYLVNSDMSALPAGAVVGGENHTPTFTAGNPHYILLTPPNNDKRGFITFAETALKPVAFSANFGLYVGNGNGADGTSFNYGKVNTSIGYGENGMIDAGLAIGFNDYNNKIIIYYNKVQLQSYNVNGTLNNSNWKSVSIQINTSGQLTLAYGGNTYCTNYQLPAAYLTDDKTNWQYGFAARCGGLNNLHAINDVVIEDHTPMQYSVDGTHYFTGNTFSNLEPGTYDVYARIGDAAYNAHGFNSTTLLGTSTITGLSVAATLTPTNPTTCSTEGGTIAISDLTHNTVPYDLINLSLTNSQGGNSTFGGLGTSSHPYWGNGNLVLTPPNSNTAGYIAFATTVAKPNAFSANYEMFVGGGSGGIGMSFNYGVLNTAGTADTPDKGMIDNGLSIGFNDFSNTITIFYNKTQLRSYSANVNAGSYKSVAITVTQDGKLTIVHGGITICSNYQLPAAYATDNKSNWQYAFAARCGGATNYHSVKNVVIKDNSIQYTIDGVNYTENPNFTNVSPGTYNVRARISNGVQCSAVSSLGSVTIATHPGSVAITAQPSITNQSVAINTAATTLSVTATGEATVSYQWYSNTTANNTGGSVIADATSASYTPPTSAAGTLYYYCVVSNACSQITSALSGSVTTYIPVPNISYTTPVTYTVDTPIAPLTPTNTGGAVASANVVSTYAGIDGTSGSENGPVASATFNYTHAMVADAAGNVYVADMPGMIRKISTDGMVTTFASGFDTPGGITIDAFGNLYVIDASSMTGMSLIKKITPAGEVTILAGNLNWGNSTVDGMGADASIGSGTGITVDPAGNVYVAEENTNKIRKITPAGLVSTLALTDVNGAAVDPVSPCDLVIDSKGNLFLTALDRHFIQKITPAGVVTTFAGSSSSGNANGIGTAATFNSAFRMVIDAQDNIFVTDIDNHLIRKITSSAVVSTYAGISGTPGTTNGPVTTATFTTPMGIALDAAGNVFVGELNYVIRKIGAGAGGYTITPALPAGLSMDAATGIISGTPTVTSAETDYTVTASNAGGSGSYTFKMRVISVPVPSADAQTLCSGSTVADLFATGTDLKWYEVATGGTALATTTTVATGTYYVSQTVSGNESERTLVAVTVNNSVAGTVSVDQLVFIGSQPADITLTGSEGTVQWQSSLDNSTFADIAEATGATLTGTQMGALTTKRYYRAVVTNGSCNAATSGVITVTVIAATKVQVSQCGQTLAALNTAIVANSVTGATNYRFKVVNGATTKTIETVGRWFYLTGGISYNTTYTISVATKHNGVWGPYGYECTVSTPLTKVIAKQCGQTLSLINSAVYADVVNNANQYQFEIRNNGIVVGELISTTYYTRLTNLSAGAQYETTYSIRVKTSSDNGVTWSAYGTACTVTTPAAPLTKVVAKQCGQTLSLINSLVYTDAVINANQYRFEISKGDVVVQELTTANYYTRLTNLTAGAQYEATYSIRVKTSLDNGATWTEYGTACTVTTPAAPLTKVRASQWNTTIPSLTTAIWALSVNGANKYKFEVVGNSQTRTLESSSSYIRLTSLAGGVSLGTVYNVRVAYSFDGGANWSAYGDACTITTPSAPGHVLSSISPTPISVYPNPFTSTFKVASSFEGIVTIRVMDLTGKLIEQFDVEASELVSKEMGQSYVPGMYHVTVSQDVQIENFKIVKND